MSAAVRLHDSIETIPDVLAFWAREQPAAPALIGPTGAVVSYGELSRRAASVAETLVERGVECGSVVALILPDGPALATALLGAASAAVAFPLDAAMTKSELEALLPRLDIGGAIVHRGLAPEARELLTRRRIPVIDAVDDDAWVEETNLGASHRQVSAGAVRPTDVATLSQTSGTTGNSKLVPRTHRLITTSGRDDRDLFGLAPDDRSIVLAPMAFALGKTSLLRALIAGSSLVFPPSLAPNRIWATIEREQPTWMQAPAGLLELLARAYRGRPPLSNSSLRFVRVTAAAISPAVCDELEQLLGAPVLPSYSASETGIVAASFAETGSRKPGAAGKPVQELRISDEKGQELGPNQEGEIWVRGRKVFDGYLDDRGLNETVFTPDGWFRTGDLGCLDGEGFLFLTGRLSEMINRGGAKISPVEVDMVLASHPAVREAATFAAPDLVLGEEIVAAVVLEPGASVAPRELRTWMLDRLSMRKIPRRIWFVQELPRTDTGKVRRGELARRWREAMS